MADTSLIFNILAKDSGLGRALDDIRRGFRGAGQEAEDALNQAASKTDNLDRQIEEAKQRVRSLAEEFERTGDRTLFGKIGRDRTLISNLEKVRSALRDTDSQADRTGSSVDNMGGIFYRLGSMASSAGGALASMASGVGSSLSSLWGLAAAAGAASAGLAVGIPAIYAFGGAAAALPGMLSGAIAAIATLKLGLFGLSENWKGMNAVSSGGGGGGAKAMQDMTPKIRAVEAAQRAVTRSARDVADAQEALREATEEVNEAREEERERIEDVRRALASARADEAESVQDLAEARMQLALAEARGNPDEIRRAQIAVDKQAASLEEAKDKTEDLQKEADEAAQKGVEGSDAVVEAKKRERDAQRRVADAVDQHKLAIQQLGDAQKALNDKMAGGGGGGGGGLSQQLPKISRSAQEFLNVLKELKPAFEELRLEVQERLFAGLGDKMRVLATTWIPQLKISLGNMADTINKVVRKAFDSLSDPEFVSNMAVGFEGFRVMLGRIGEAIAGPLVDAWGRLSRASAPFMEMIGDKVAGLIIRFSEWIKKMDESGKLDEFFEKATHIGGKLFDIFGNLASITGSVIAILFGTNAGSTDAWDNLAAGVEKVAKWLADPENQKKVSDFFDRFGGAVFMIGNLLAKLDQLWNRLQAFIGWVEAKYNSVKNFFQTLPDRIGEAFKKAGDTISAFPGRVGSFLARLPGIVGQHLTNVINRMGYLIGYGIGTAVRFFASLPGRVTSALRALPGVVSRAVSNAISWLQKMGPRAYNAVRNVATNVLNGIGDLPGRLWNVGYNAVLGLWRGIQSLSGWLYNRARSFASNIWRGMMDALQIGSPSRVMADRVGRWVPIGIAEGIDNEAPAVQAAAARIATALAGTRMSIPGLDLNQIDGAVAAATGTVQVTAARRKPIEVVTRLDITGADGDMIKMIRKWERTANLSQRKG